jgi:uncharacterized protein (DUF362 family)
MSKITRREFLRLTAVGIGAVVGAPALAACSQPPAAITTPEPSSPPERTLPSPTLPPVVTSTASLPTETQKPKASRPVQVGASIVSVVQSGMASVEEITEAEVQHMVQQAVDLAGGLQNLIRDGQTVVLKPNLYGKVYQVSGEPVSPQASGVVTDWRVTRAVVQLVRQINPSGKVYVMEGSCLAPTADIFQHLKYTPENIPGVDAFIPIEIDSGAWQDLSSPGLVKMDLPDGLWKTSYYLNRKYKEADVVISLPVLKNHSYAAISGSIKNVAIGASPANIYGKSATDDNRFNSIPHDRVNFHKWVHDYYRCRPVDFAVVDALQGLQNGPMCYTDPCDLPRDQMGMRLILAGGDALAVDAIQSLVMGWDPESIPYLKLLNQSSLGNLDTAWITVAGSPVDVVRKYFAGPAPQCGGGKVYDKQPPSLAVQNAVLEGGKLSIRLDTDEKTNKVEVYIDDQLLASAAGADFHSLALDGSQIAPGVHTLKVWAYDRFLNRAEQTLETDFSST